MYIVYDLEHLAARNLKEPTSIIELGAIKVNKDLAVIDHFHSIIRPSRFAPSSYKFTNQITKIEYDDLLNAPTFQEVITEFLHWILYPLTNDYYLCNWGGSDVRLLFDECGRSKVNPYWIVNNNDIQGAISLYLTNRSSHQMSLSSAVKKSLNIDSFDAHTAIDDAWMTSLLFIEHFDIINLKRNSFERSKIDTPVYKEKFKNNPFSSLKSMFSTE